MINNLTLFEKAIILVSKSHFNKHGKKSDLIKKLVAWEYGLDVKYIIDYIELINVRRIYFKINPQLNMLSQIEYAESEVNRDSPLYNFTESDSTFKKMTEVFASFISSTQVKDNDLILIDLSLKAIERREIIKVLKK